IDLEAINHLVEYKWKGNVRELKNVIERSVLFADFEEEFLLEEHLPEEIIGIDKEDTGQKVDMTLKDYEKILIENTLKRNEGNKTRTAEILGIKRQTLYNKIREYKIKA
ncbi:MAG TPA: helix-turn-helix domain-containing protein, partial [Clostridia bacterium]|nr:helix-turn-helix domain-containing protein [Clostridia bacterium]